MRGFKNAIALILCMKYIHAYKLKLSMTHR